MEARRPEGQGVYGVLRSPIRREIILFLYSSGEASAAQLRSLTKISYGTLYYHLEFMRPFIEPVGRGRFKLSKQGVMLARRILDDSTLPTSGGFKLENIALGTIFSRFSSFPAVLLGVGAAILIYSIYASSVLELNPAVLHMKGGGFNASLWLISVSVLFTYLLAAHALLRRGTGSFTLLIAGALLSYVPIAIYLSILVVLIVIINLQPLPQLVQIGFIIAHVWQLVILASSLTHSSGAGYQKSLPAVLLLSYISLLFSQIL